MDSPRLTPPSTRECKFSEIDTRKNEITFSQKKELTKVEEIAQKKLEKCHPDATITKLHSTLEIKQRWLYSEWAPECQFSKKIIENFPNRDDLDPKNEKPDVDLIVSTFEYVRGRWILWQTPREEARWKKIEVTALKLDWVLKNVEVLYPSEDRFQVSELNGLVLWDVESNNGKKYQLYEGNHRVSNWIATKWPETLPATIFVGKPKK